MLRDWAQSIGGTEVAAVGILACGISFAYIGLKLRSQRHYLWLAAGAVTFALWWGSARSLPPPEYLAQRGLMGSFVALLLGLGALWTGLARHYLEDRPMLARTVVRGLWVFNLVLVLVLLWGIAVQLELPRLVVVAALLVQTVPMVVLGLYAARREPGVGHALSALSLLVIPAAGLYLIAVEGHAMVLRFIATMPFLAMCIAVLPAAFIREHRRLAQEVSARERAEARLRESNDMLLGQSQRLREALHAAQAGERAKTRFLAVMGHELRTPLTGLSGSLDVLHREALPANLKPLVQQALGSSRELGRQLDNIVTYARLEAGAPAPAPVSVPIESRLQVAMAPWRALARDKGLGFNLRLEDLPAVVRVDIQKWLQIADELLANAVKFTETGSIDVTVRFDRDGHRLVLQVQDSGIGVAEGRELDIFTPFEQADMGDIEVRLHGGSGLGLAIARRLARSLAGEVRFERHPDAGSVFTVDVPAEPAASGGLCADCDGSPGACPQGRAGAERLRGRRVLVVEDNAVVRRLVGTMLRKMGVEAVDCPEATRALATIEAQDFDAVLMDLSMPGMSGLEATRQIRRWEAGPGRRTARLPLPIIGISAHAAPEDRQRCHEAGMSGYLPKPITWDQLSAALQASLGQPEEARDVAAA